MAYLLVDNTKVCGGSVISQNWVISAARCVYRVSQVVVYLRINDITITVLHLTNATFTIHPDYQYMTGDNDIALLKLEKPAPLSAAIQPICLPYKFSTRDFARQNATVTGWGVTSQRQTNKTNKLMEVTMSILNKAQCTASPYLYSPYSVTDNMFCMYVQADVGACDGDFGDPVSWQNGTNTYLLGIYTGGSCGDKGYPGLYTKVSIYLNWITNTTGQTFCNV